MQTSNLLEQTRELLQTTKANYQVVARYVGCSVRWLYQVRNDEKGDYGVRKISRVYDYLKDFERRVLPGGGTRSK